MKNHPGEKKMSKEGENLHKILFLKRIKILYNGTSHLQCILTLRTCVPNKPSVSIVLKPRIIIFLTLNIAINII